MKISIIYNYYHVDNWKKPEKQKKTKKKTVAAVLQPYETNKFD